MVAGRTAPAARPERAARVTPRANIRKSDNIAGTVMIARMAVRGTGPSCAHCSGRPHRPTFCPGLRRGGQASPIRAGTWAPGAGWSRTARSRVRAADRALSPFSRPFHHFPWHILGQKPLLLTGKGERARKVVKGPQGRPPGHRQPAARAGGPPARPTGRQARPAAGERAAGGPVAWFGLVLIYVGAFEPLWRLLQHGHPGGRASTTAVACLCRTEVGRGWH